MSDPYKNPYQGNGFWSPYGGPSPVPTSTQRPRFLSPWAEVNATNNDPSFQQPIRPESSVSNRSFKSQISIETDVTPAVMNSNGQRNTYAYAEPNHNVGNESDRGSSGQASSGSRGYVTFENLPPGVNVYGSYAQAPSQQFRGHLSFNSGYTPNVAAPPFNSLATLPSNESNGPSMTAFDKAQLIMRGEFDDDETDAFSQTTPNANRRNTVNDVPSPVGAFGARGRYGHAPTRARAGTAIEHGNQLMAVAESPVTSIGTYIKDNIGINNPPAWFNKVTDGSGFMPSLDQAFIDMPFAQQFKEDVHPSTCGFIKITNVPFAVTRNEIVAHLGRSARIMNLPPGSPYFSVHVMMERMTGKTMDVFVEVADSNEARHIVMSSNRRAANFRTPRLGDRMVTIELSSQEEFMSTLFAKAKDTTWVGAMPHVEYRSEEVRPGVWTQGFKGFLQPDEINMFVKFATSPLRSPFIHRSPNRVYESLITTLHKYPWYACEHVFLNERKLLCEATNVLIKSLAYTITAGPRAALPGLTHNLLQEVVVAAMTCPGFNERQKAGFAHTLRSSGYTRLANGTDFPFNFGGIHPYSTNWPFVALTKLPTARNDFLEYYVSLMRSATTDSDTTSLSEMLAQRRGLRNESPKPFGDVVVDYKCRDMANMTLQACADRELEYLQAILASVIPRTTF